MAQAGHRTGFWRSVRRLPERTPLRVKLITAVLALVAIALAVISILGIGFLRSYLLGQANSQLYALASSQRVQAVVQEAAADGGQVRGLPSGVVIDWYPNGGKLQQISRPYSSLAQGLSPYGGSPPGPQVTTGAAWLTSRKPVTVPAASGSGRWQVLAVPQFPVPAPGGSVVIGTVIYGVSVTSVYQTLGRLAAVDWVVSAILLVALFVIGVAVVRSSLRPLTDIERTAGAIAAGDLTQRVPERDPRTEVGRLGRSLNIMLGQIETAFRARSESAREARRSEERMRQFVADASHELRTPLTAIRGFAEYYRQRGGIAVGGESGEPEARALSVPGGEPGDSVPAGTAPDGEPGGSIPAGTAPDGNGQLARADLDRIMRRVEQESARMGILVEDMLLLARLDQQRPLENRPVDLLTLAADAVHDARVVAPDRDIALTVMPGAALLLRGDEVRLRQVIGNLMSNALTHTPDGTPIEVRLRGGRMDELAGSGAASSGGATANSGKPATAAVLEVRDSGPGLSAEQADRVFERFYRADQARPRGGAGLGLAIVAALVAAHGGVSWVDSKPGEGATFGIALPLEPEAIESPQQEDAEADGEFCDDTDAAWGDSAPTDSAPTDSALADNRSGAGGPARDRGSSADR